MKTRPKQLLGSLPLDIKLPGKNDILAFSALSTLIERRKFSLSISLIQRCLYEIFRPNIAPLMSVIVPLHIIQSHLSQSRPCLVKLCFYFALTHFFDFHLSGQNCKTINFLIRLILELLIIKHLFFQFRDFLFAFWSISYVW